MAEIDLQECSYCDVADKDLCSVYTTFNGECQTLFVFSAERSFMERITEIMLEEPVTDPEEVVEYMEEFVNILCGHIAASIFRITKAPIRFHSPCFIDGAYLAEDIPAENMIVSYFADSYSENAILSRNQFLS